MSEHQQKSQFPGWWYKIPFFVGSILLITFVAVPYGLSQINQQEVCFRSTPIETPTTTAPVEDDHFPGGPITND
jgi:hypothetical protein